MIPPTPHISCLLAYVPGTGLLFGLMLVAAIAGGYLAQLTRVPRVIGYLAGGAALHLFLQYALDIKPETAQHAALAAAEKPLKAIKDLGLGIILFTIGGVFETRNLRSVGARLARLSAAECGLTALLVFFVVCVAALATRGTAEWGVTVCFSLLLGLAAIATAPAATIFTLREYEAKGPLTDAILAVVGVNNVVCIVLFNVAFLSLAASGALGETNLSPSAVGWGLLLTTVGSVVLALVLGFILSIVHAKLRIGEALLILTAMLIVLGAGEEWLLHNRGVSYSFLLATIGVGAAFANLAIDPDRLIIAVRTMGRPVLVGFFVIAGYQLHLSELDSLGWIGAAYVIARLTGKLLGGAWGVRRLAQRAELPSTLGAALLCQAAVVIGLAELVSGHWLHPWAAKAFATTALGSVVVFELIGPLAIKWSVVRAGEVKAVTLLRRAGPAADLAEGESVLRLTWEALLRTFGVAGARVARSGEELKVRHVMRTSVKCLHAADRMDDVLHFIEQSRYNHFPVVDDDERLVGVIHFADIRNFIYDPRLAELVTAVDLANPATPPVMGDWPLSDVLEVFRRADVGSLPVLDGSASRRVVGILEQRDVLRAMHKSRARQLPKS